MSARILIADDHEVLRHGLRSMLAKVRPAWEVCGEAENGAETIRLVRELQPDIVILDITMPEMSGIEAASHIRRLGIKVPIVLFTTHQSERLHTDARAAGAQGVVLKSEAFKNLVQAIDVILEGGTFFQDNPKTEASPDDKPKPGILFRLGFAPAIWGVGLEAAPS